MRLTIDHEEVSYSLEHERTLGEVVHGVHRWLADAGFLITALSADGLDLLSSKGWEAKPLTEVTSLAVQTAHTGEMKIAHWRTVDRWLDLLAAELDRKPEDPPSPQRPGPRASSSEGDPLGDLLADLPQTLQGLAANPFAPPGSDAMGRFVSLFQGTPASEIRTWPRERRQEAEKATRELRGLLQARIHDATQPEQAMAARLDELEGSLGELKEVSVLLQTGRDRPAMESVVRFTDIAQSIIDLLPFLPPDPQRARLFAELTPVLRELVGAFDTRDSVLIGDLLEYEVAPRLEQLAPLLGGRK